MVETRFAFPPREPTTVAVAGDARVRVPVRRVYCVAQNYAAHAREMNTDPERESPAFFTKPADAVIPALGTLPFPRATAELHHEVELVLVLAGGGVDLDIEAARACIWGYGVGLDLTRRDQQRRARQARGPWDIAKAFDASAPVSEVHRRTEVGEIVSGRIWLAVNGTLRQDSDLGRMIWDPAEIVSQLSRYFCLASGDFVFTGTPEGVGPLVPGDAVTAGIDRLEELELRVGEREGPGNPGS